MGDQGRRGQHASFVLRLNALTLVCRHLFLCRLYRIDRAAVNLTELIQKHGEDILTNNRRDLTANPIADGQDRGAVREVNTG